MLAMSEKELWDKATEGLGRWVEGIKARWIGAGIVAQLAKPNLQHQ